MTHSFWPLLDLRVTVGDLELAPLVEADLAEVVQRLPADLELNPAATRFAVDEATHRGVVVHQEYWRSYGTWTTQAWRFHLAVRRDGELLGLQELEGNEFPRLRTVDTSSWRRRSASTTAPNPRSGKRRRSTQPTHTRSQSWSPSNGAACMLISLPCRQR